MPIEIQEFRLSFIWTETVLTLLNEQVPTDAPLKELGREESYKSLFEKILAIQRVGKQTIPINALTGTTQRVTIPTPPWPNPDGQHFWQRYLQIQSLHNVAGSKAWNALVPLRAKFPCMIKAGDWLDNFPASLSFLLESFFYPHGVAFVATVDCYFKQPESPAQPTALTLADAVKLAFAVKTKKFNAAWNGVAGLFSAFSWESTPAGGIKLDSLAERALAAAKLAALGPSNPDTSAPVDPFTIFTIVRADGANSWNVDEDVQRALDRVAGWNPNPNATLPPLDTAKIDVKAAGPGRVLYSRTRGRSVWFQDLFSDPDQQHLLRCYHRNLTFVSLQVDSLSGFASEVATLIKEHKDIPQPIFDCAKKAGGSLGRLYGNKQGNKKYKKSYRSLSSPTQMDQNNYTQDVNLVRTTLGMRDLGAGELND